MFRKEGATTNDRRGFGIRDIDTAPAFGRIAVARAIGSRLIQVIESKTQNDVTQAAADFLRAHFSNALDQEYCAKTE
jgi:tryptophan synthase alpha subunit